MKKIEMDINSYRVQPGTSLHSIGGDYRLGNVPTPQGTVKVIFNMSSMKPQFLLWLPPQNHMWQSNQEFKSWEQMQFWARKFAAKCAARNTGRTRRGPRIGEPV